MLEVWFSSEFREVACRLFADYINTIEVIEPVKTSLSTVHYSFTHDNHVQDIRVWGSSAMICGLVETFSCKYLN